MRVFWESIGILGPIYRSVGKGLADAEIASMLNLTDSTVQSCIAWMLHFLKLTNREDLVLYASSVVRPIAAIEH
jgi:DNA-binding NarL/FixJ family response regulator